MKKSPLKSILKKIAMFLFLFIVSLDVLIDYVEIISGDYSTEIQTLELHAPNQFQSLGDNASQFYYSQFNSESEGEEYESKYYILAVLSYIKYSNYLDFVVYHRAVHLNFLHKEYNAFQEYSIPPPLA